MKLFLTRLAAFAMISLMTLCTVVMVEAGTTGIISGTVKDAETGTVLSGANIIVNGTKLSTVTDAAGRFIIINVPPGEYEINAELIGYAVETLGTVQVTMDTTAVADFDLRKEAIAEEGTIINRARPMINAEVANTLNLVTVQQEDMARLDPASVRAAPGILGALPGVLVETNGSGQIHVRGGRMDQTGWYLEGIPITDPNMGAFGTNLFTTGMSKFQVYTGGFGAEYGNAIAGVLNEIKKTGADTPGFTLNTESGNGAYRNMFAEVGGGDAESFNYYVGTALNQNDMETTVLDRQEYADTAVKMVWPSKNDKLTFIGMQGSLYGRMLDHIGYNRQRYMVSAVTWSHNFNPSSFITVQPYYLTTIVAYNTNGLDDAYLDLWSAQKGLKVNYTNQLNDQHLLKAGGTIVMSNNNTNYNFPLYADYGMANYWYQADVDTRQTDLFAEDQIKLTSKLTAQAGLRLDNMKYDRTGLAYMNGAGYSGEPVSDITESTITPRLGLTYAANERTVWKTNWGKYSKFVPASSVQKIYALPDDPMTEAYSPGLGATAPQKSKAWEVSYEKQLNDTLAYRLTSFRADFENLGDLYTDPDTGISTFTNLGQGKSTGAEVYIRKKMSDNWQGWLSYTYQKVKANKADLGLLSDTYYTSWDQLHTLSLVANYKIGRCGHSLRVDMGSGRSDINTTEAGLLVGDRANPYAILSYNLHMDLPADSSLGNSIYLNVYNLFNSGQTMQYQNDGSTRSITSWLPSRSISVGVSKAF